MRHKRKACIFIIVESFSDALSSVRQWASRIVTDMALLRTALWSNSQLTVFNLHSLVIQGWVVPAWLFLCLIYPCFISSLDDSLMRTKQSHWRGMPAFILECSTGIALMPLSVYWTKLCHSSVSEQILQIVSVWSILYTPPALDLFFACGWPLLWSFPLKLNSSAFIHGIFLV